MLLDKYPEAGLPDRMVLLFLDFCRTSILFSAAAVKLCVLTSSVQDLHRVYILTNACFSLVLRIATLGVR